MLLLIPNIVVNVHNVAKIFMWFSMHVLHVQLTNFLLNKMKYFSSSGISKSLVVNSKLEAFHYRARQYVSSTMTLSVLQSLHYFLETVL